MSRPRATLAAALAGPLLGALGASCVQTTTTRLAAPEASGLIRTAQPGRAWRLTEKGELRAFVVFFESSRDPAESFFSVRNAWHQELGVIDSLGIAWRYRPHEREAEHVVTGTILEGAAAIVEANAPCALEEMELSELRATDPTREPKRGEGASG